MTFKHWPVRPLNLLTFWLLIVLIAGCGGSLSDPLALISNQLRGVPTYSIILDDMKEEGNFFKDYFHKYRIVVPEQSTITDWMPVGKDFYQQHLPFLGMTIFVKKEGQEAAEAGPPGYEYVGDPKYGRWRTDEHGRSFWEFFGPYLFLSHLLGPGPIYRRDYDTYRNYRTQRRPYYGPKQEYGTKGSYTRKQKPDFYSRRMSKASTSKSTFGDKVSRRIGRSRSLRGRSRRVGK